MFKQLVKFAKQKGKTLIINSKLQLSNRTISYWGHCHIDALTKLTIGSLMTLTYYNLRGHNTLQESEVLPTAQNSR